MRMTIVGAQQRPSFPSLVDCELEALPPPIDLLVSLPVPCGRVALTSWSSDLLPSPFFP